MSLYDDLEEVCGLIKHMPEGVDLGDIRSLLRRAQHQIELVDVLRRPARFVVTPADAWTRKVTISATMDASVAYELAATLLRDEDE